MPQNKFEEKAARYVDHNDFTAYINQVKKDAVDTEYHGAVEHELNRATQSVFNQLTMLTDSTQILLFTGMLRGLQLAANYVAAQWPIDKETE